MQLTYSTVGNVFNLYLSFVQYFSDHLVVALGLRISFVKVKVQLPSLIKKKNTLVPQVIMKELN